MGHLYAVYGNPQSVAVMETYGWLKRRNKPDPAVGLSITMRGRVRGSICGVHA